MLEMCVERKAGGSLFHSGSSRLDDTDHGGNGMEEEEDEEKEEEKEEEVEVCTYNQHGRPHHLRDTLPELGRRARLTQTPRKLPGLRVRRGGHGCAPLRINDGPR